MVKGESSSLLLPHPPAFPPATLLSSLLFCYLYPVLQETKQKQLALLIVPGNHKVFRDFSLGNDSVIVYGTWRELGSWVLVLFIGLLSVSLFLL